MSLEDRERRIRVDVHLQPGGDTEAREALRDALEERPRRIPSRFFYDDKGSELFEQITELPEYYPTRTEAKILRAVADDVAARSQAGELVELGSGSATKTRILLDAMERTGLLKLYVPVDISEPPVRQSARELVVRYPSLEVHGVVGDFLLHLDQIPHGGVPGGPARGNHRQLPARGSRPISPYRPRRHGPRGLLLAGHGPGQGRGPPGSGLRRLGGRRSST